MLNAITKVLKTRKGQVAIGAAVLWVIGSFATGEVLPIPQELIDFVGSLLANGG